MIFLAKKRKGKKKKNLPLLFCCHCWIRDPWWIISGSGINTPVPFFLFYKIIISIHLSGQWIKYFCNGPGTAPKKLFGKAGEQFSAAFQIRIRTFYLMQFSRMLKYGGTVPYIPQVSTNAPVCFRTYLLCTLTIILLIFYDRKDGNKKTRRKAFRL